MIKTYRVALMAIAFLAMTTNAQKITYPQPPTEEVVDEYFSGQRKFFNLPYRFTGTEFQKRVWQSISRIVYGKTVSYEEIARLSGVGNAGMTVRAVANAIGANKLSVIVPCHRIIRKNGETGGYAGGKEAKRYLLELEEAG